MDSDEQKAAQPQYGQSPLRGAFRAWMLLEAVREARQTMAEREPRRPA